MGKQFKFGVSALDGGRHTVWGLSTLFDRMKNLAGFHGNQFNDAREDITLESDAQITDPSTITININDPSGTSSLSQANNNAWIHYLPDSSVLDQFVFINPTGDEVR